DLLTEREQILFRRLAVFAGGCELAAAEAGAVLGSCASGSCASGSHASAGERILAELPVPDMLDVLGALVGKSLVVVAPTTPTARYRLLEPVRQYAQHRLEASGEVEAARARHAEQYAALAERAAPELRGSAQLAWLGRLDHERDNLWAALAWILERGDA